MKKINQEEYKNIVANGKYVVDFYADWCGPCKMISPVLESLEKDLNASGIELLKINVDDNPVLAEEMQIRYIPYIVTVADGKVRDSFSGYKNADDLRKFIENSLSD